MKHQFQKIQNRLDKLKKVRNNTSVSIFLFCLLISVFIWTLIKMSKDYSSDIDYTLIFQNPPSNQIISEVIDSVVYLHINASGFDHINRRYLKRQKALIIDLNKVKIHTNRYSMGNYILSESLLNQIRNQYEFPNTINRIFPDTLHLKLDNTISKEVDIKLQLDIIPKQQHYLYGDITKSIQKTTIIGPQSYIDTVDFILTEQLKLENIEADQQLSLRLLNPYPEHYVKLSDQKVDVLVPIQQYTENNISIPIQIKNSASTRIKLFPETVNIKFLVALKDYERINKGMFSAIVKYDKKLLNHQKVILDRIPNFVKVISFEPKNVEYLILINND